MLNVRDTLETHRCYDDRRHGVTPSGVAKPTEQLPWQRKNRLMWAALYIQKQFLSLLYPRKYQKKSSYAVYIFRIGIKKQDNNTEDRIADFAHANSVTEVCMREDWFSWYSFTSLCKNMTSFKKTEVHNVSHCRQKRAEPRPQIDNTCRIRKFHEVRTFGYERI